LKVKRRFGEDRFAGQQRFARSRREADGPFVMPVVPVRERHEQAGVGDGFHRFENPFRVDRSRAPRTDPASRKKGGAAVARAFASCSRTI
jgi:hypothetical protein